MTKTTSPHILILGATGMLGSMVFSVLMKQYPKTTWGTVRKKRSLADRFLFFDAQNEQGLEAVHRQIGALDYIINCIGTLRSNEDKKSMKYINSIFPPKLALLAQQYGSNLIHVSTDAVFAPDERVVYEDTKPSPTDYYGETKLAGEPHSPNAITIRTSIIGFDPREKKSLLEQTLTQKEVIGYTNQRWSGCTTIQFAKFCLETIVQNRFEDMRKVSPLFHFSPIADTTKYEILCTFLSTIKSDKKLTKATGFPVTRTLQTNYSDILSSNSHQTTIKDALRELINYQTYKES